MDMLKECLSVFTLTRPEQLAEADLAGLVVKATDTLSVSFPPPPSAMSVPLTIAIANLD